MFGWVIFQYFMYMSVDGMSLLSLVTDFSICVALIVVENSSHECAIGEGI